MLFEELLMAFIVIGLKSKLTTQSYFEIIYDGADNRLLALYLLVIKQIKA